MRFFGRIERQRHGTIIYATVDSAGVSPKKLRKALARVGDLQLGQMLRKDLPSAGALLESDVQADGRIGLRAVKRIRLPRQAIEAVYSGIMIDVAAADHGRSAVQLSDPLMAPQPGKYSPVTLGDDEYYVVLVDPAVSSAEDSPVVHGAWTYQPYWESGIPARGRLLVWVPRDLEPYFTQTPAGFVRAEDALQKKWDGLTEFGVGSAEACCARRGLPRPRCCRGF